MPLSDVFATVFSGLSIVFIALIVLIISVSLISLALKRNKNQSSVKSIVTTPQPDKKILPVVEDGISDEVVAVIAAAIAAMSSETEGTTYAIRGIKAIRTARPVWAFAGMQENTRPF